MVAPAIKMRVHQEQKRQFQVDRVHRKGPLPRDYSNALLPDDERIAIADESLARTVGAYGDGMSHRVRDDRLAAELRG
ncbi:MAG: hypothetical protein ACRDRI_00460 [Pseudonocardiaceae bacterium]